MKPRQLSNIGVPPHAIPAAIRGCASAARRRFTGSEIKSQVLAVLEKPSAFADHPDFGELATAIITRGQRAVADQPRLDPVPYQTWGASGIDQGAHDQMALACRLPVSVAGALMPDAHIGYGLPIGGVLATESCVIPYAVGVDIACRMMLTVFDLPPERLTKDRERFEHILERNTLFGTGAGFKRNADHPVIDEDWRITPVTAQLKDKAAFQLGSSGSGNHFVEFGKLEVFPPPTSSPAAPTNASSPAAGGGGGRVFEAGGGSSCPPSPLTVHRSLSSPRLALLSHSGSRGPGAMVANHYSALARRLHPDLPKELSYLAWLDLNKGEGQEYWAAMELMGRFASANHHIIHAKIARDLAAMDAPILFQVENHHNYAWRETHTITIDGRAESRDLIIHRKGATPAGRGVLGLIPGSMAAPGYLVEGLGNPASLNSAAHGAGRQLSRTKARESTRWSHLRGTLEAADVHLLSAGLDESPHAYKDIESVMAAQSDLVRPLARFMPRLVKMAPDGERPED